MEIVKDCVVTIAYTVQLEDGSFVKGSHTSPASLNFTAGYQQILPALERQLYGLREGDEVRFVIPAEEAFGPHRQDLCRRKRYEDFPEGRYLEEGRWVVATNEATGAQYSYKVIEKTDHDVLLDFNHPLAGHDLFYRVKVLKVRPATEEELHFLRPCEFGKPSTNH